MQHAGALKTDAACRRRSCTGRRGLSDEDLAGIDVLRLYVDSAVVARSCGFWLRIIGGRSEWISRTGSDCGLRKASSMPLAVRIFAPPRRSTYSFTN